MFRGLTNVHEDLNYHLTIGFVAYFVIGYVIVSHVSEKGYNYIPIGCLFFVLGAVFTFLEIMITNSEETVGSFLNYYQMAILLQSSGVILLFKSLQSRRIVGTLKMFSPLTLGIYIIHPMIIEILQKNNITSLTFNPIISIPLLSLAVFLVAGGITLLLRRSPLKLLLIHAGGYK